MLLTPKGAQSSGGGDRNGLRVPLIDDRSRTWSYDLFDCFSDSRTCALSFCCCCYVYSRNKRRLDHLETHGTPLREPVERYNHDCVSYSWLQFLLCSGWVLSAISRSDVRRRYGIRGDSTNDVLVSGCCHPCELVQQHREIQLEESSFYLHVVIMLGTISCMISFTRRMITHDF
ncbi:PLAC8 family-domain-containing protein [Russula emetica]|nr:PLAC8 family-domain-containing protein [Russula emetica]